MLGRALDTFSARRPAAATQLLLGRVVAALGTDPNRRLSDIRSVDVSDQIEHDEPSSLGGQCRIVLACKRTGGLPRIRRRGQSYASHAEKLDPE